MLSKSKISFIKSLHQKKYRKENGLFIIEGSKSLEEFINTPYQIDSIFYTPKASASLPHFSANISLFEISEAELQKISTLKMPQDLLALVLIPQKTTIDPEYFKGKYTLMLDSVQDPGNFGTIIRIADWFGIQDIICSEDTAEVYNPKVVHATMGSLARINIWQTNLETFIEKISVPIYGALLDGKNIYDIKWADEGIILLGNEGHGISQELIKKISVPVTIPRFGEAESLNVAVSAAIFCNEVRRIK